MGHPNSLETSSGQLDERSAKTLKIAFAASQLTLLRSDRSRFTIECSGLEYARSFTAFPGAAGPVRDWFFCAAAESGASPDWARLCSV